jgi:septum formation protein
MGRRLLLEKLGVRFRAVPTHINEEGITDKDPIKTLKKRAIAKANEIVQHPHVYAIPETGKVLVIAADSEAIIGTKTYGKSVDREDSKRIVKELMGKTHTFVTALCIVLLDLGKETQRWEKVVSTKVTLRKLTTAELDLYVNRYDFTRFSGGYSINEAPWDIVTKMDGSYTNVVGLPFEELLPILRNLDIIKPPNTP